LIFLNLKTTGNKSVVFFDIRIERLCLCGSAKMILYGSSFELGITLFEEEIAKNTISFIRIHTVMLFVHKKKSW
jgi:hypothetical protein